VPTTLPLLPLFWMPLLSLRSLLSLLPLLPPFWMPLLSLLSLLSLRARRRWLDRTCVRGAAAVAGSECTSCQPM